MADPVSADQILEFAIEREQEAADFYHNLAARSNSDVMRDVFEQFAREEERHRDKLTAVKVGSRGLGSSAGIQDLSLADYLVEKKPDPDMSYQDALVLAMHKEKAAFKLYSELAGLAEDVALRDLFLSLAQEEAKHKLRFELEYDENVLREN